MPTATPSVCDEMIEMRGLRFAYRDWASAASNAPALVVLHGYTGHAHTWDAFASAMCDRYRVLALDQRGHGRSDWSPDHAYGTEEMVEDLRAFVGALGLTRFSLLGLSMGGLVSIAYAGLRPAGLERLVIVDIAPEITTAGRDRIAAGAQGADTFDTREAAIASARAANPRADAASLRHRVERALMLRQDGRWTFRYDRALRDPRIPRNRLAADEGWRRAARIAVPTLLVRGAISDILSPEIAERLAREIGQCRLEEIAGAGHSVPLEKPREFLALAREFL